ncbi:hypothetical protein HOLleu_44279 [Holothuria leucospilota]|uniref:CUB domain-containing protein n=1 Tax=Holothuria leucospilota TaxID=206669 RepID=A0A9Q0YG15_HOLLE|nr:hypothetical protein HOLleu_44279 [Holothuria leucospilota]
MAGKYLSMQFATKMCTAWITLMKGTVVLSPVQKMVKRSQLEIFVISTGTVKSLVKTRTVKYDALFTFFSSAPFGEDFCLPFTSPEYPSPLPESTTWTYSLAVEEGLTTNFTFYEFDLVDGVDFLTFGCGRDPTNESQFVAILTGQETPPPVIANCSLIFSQLQAGLAKGSEGSRSGFTGIIQVGFITCPENGYEVSTRNICDFYWDCEESGEDEKDCLPFGEDFRLPFTSPEYPSPLPESTTWTYYWQ